MQELHRLSVDDSPDPRQGMSAMLGRLAGGALSPRRVASDLQTAVKYVQADTRRRRTNFCIGLLTVFLVVTFVCLLENSISHTAVVFMKLAEDELGETDLLLSPSAGGDVSSSSAASTPAAEGGGGGGTSDGADDADTSTTAGSLLGVNIASYFINSTAVAARLQNTSDIVGTSPRWTLLGRLRRGDNALVNSTIIVLAIDSEQELRIGLGRRWAHPPLPPAGVHVSASVLRRLNVTPNAGENVTLLVDAIGLLSSFGSQSPADLVSSVIQQQTGIDINSLSFGNSSFFTANVSEALKLLQPLVPTANLDSVLASLITDPVLRARFLSTRLNETQELFSLYVQSLQEQLTAVMPLVVHDAFEKPVGKFAKALGNVAILESTYLQFLVKQQADLFSDALNTTLQNLGELSAALPSVLPSPTDGSLSNQQLLDAMQAALIQATGNPLAKIPPQVTSAVLNAPPLGNSGGGVLRLLNALRNATVAVRMLERGLSLFRAAADTVYLPDYAMTVQAMYSKRISVYMKDLEPLQADFIDLSNQVAEALGIAYPATLSTPLAGAMVPLYFIRLFLDKMVFTFSAVVLMLLGCLLIYSLLLANVEEKTYEYGMMRALGMRHYVLIQLIIAQSLFFAIPGVASGLFVGWLLYLPVSYVLSFYVKLPMDVSLEGSAAAVSIALGLVMPLVANVGPIQRALSGTLRDALDVYHQVKSELTVTIIKLESVGLSAWQFVLAIMMIVMGFTVYYLMPMAFLLQEISLFLVLLVLVLLGMLLGVAILSQVFQPLIERNFLSLFIWGRDRRTLLPLVRKNLASHLHRNRKTAMMFTISLAFIIFAGVVSTLQGHTIADQVSMATGSDMLILSLQKTSPLAEEPMRAYLLEEMARPGSIVLGFTFVSFPLSQMTYIGRTDLSNLAGTPNVRVSLQGIEQEYVNSTYGRFYQPIELSNYISQWPRSDGQRDALAALYTQAHRIVLPIESGGVRVPPDPLSVLPKGPVPSSQGAPFVMSQEEAYRDNVDLVMSESLRTRASVSTSTPLRLRVWYRESSTVQQPIAYLGKATGMLSNLPGDLTFSSYQQFATGSSVLISMDSFYRLMQTAHNSSMEKDTTELPAKPPKQKLLIRLVPNSPLFSREAVANSVRNFISDDLTQVVDSQDLVSSTDTAILVLNVFFLLVSSVAITLCFFVLWLSFVSNVKENSWEFGVLRAIGLTAWQITRVYIYEALAIVAGSVLLGTSIGLATAVTLTLQFVLFTELPFTFDFPYLLFGVLVCLATLVALVGSYIPAHALARKEIAQTLKNL